jgi:hypothetical protein
VAGSSEHGNEHYGPTKGRKLLHTLSDYQIHRRILLLLTLPLGRSCHFYPEEDGSRSLRKPTVYNSVVLLR